MAGRRKPYQTVTDRKTKTMAREVVNIMLFNQRLVYTNRLWEPETKDLQGNPMETPQFSATIIVPKTKANWSEEPSLKPLVDAMGQVYQTQMAGIQAQYVEWGVKDGDRPNTKGKTPDWGKGHWVIRAGTGFKPTVAGVIDGREVELPSQSIGGRKFFGDGDYSILALGVTVSSTNASRIKLYLSSVLFTGKGEAIATSGGGVSASEMMAAARAQGVNVTGIAGGVQGGAPAGGFGGGAPAPMQGGMPSFTPPGGAPAPAPAPAAPGAGGPTFTPPGGSTFGRTGDIPF